MSVKELSACLHRCSTIVQHDEKGGSRCVVRCGLYHTAIPDSHLGHGEHQNPEVIALDLVSDLGTDLPSNETLTEL